MEPERDLDSYGKLLMSGDVARVKSDYQKRLDTCSKLLQNGTSSLEALPLPQQRVANDIYAMRWGPTEVPVYNLLNLFTIIIPHKRRDYLNIARFLIDVAKVPVDAPDLSGTRALSHSFSTKPSFDLEYAQILYDAGGDVNSRDRYGGTVAFPLAQIYEMHNYQVIERSRQGLVWFLNHGGNIDIEDGDGMTMRKMCKKLSRFPATKPIMDAIAAEDRRREHICEQFCALCARTADESTLAKCSRCKKVSYCSRLRQCQRLDWPRHKKICKEA